MNLRVLSLLEKILNQTAISGKDDNVSFWCPKCAKETGHNYMVLFAEVN